jgi:hypothetical protein
MTCGHCGKDECFVYCNDCMTKREVSISKCDAKFVVYDMLKFDNSYEKDPVHFFLCAKNWYKVKRNTKKRKHDILLSLLEIIADEQATIDRLKDEINDVKHYMPDELKKMRTEHDDAIKNQNKARFIKAFLTI